LELGDTPQKQAAGKMTEDGFSSKTASLFAGQRALAGFLADLWKEEKRPRK
jgi:hypothetical protein